MTIIRLLEIGNWRLEIGDWRYYYLIFDIGYLEFGFRSFDTGS